MSITEEQFHYMVDSTTSDLVRMLMQKQHIGMTEALDRVYMSHTYQALSNPETKLYFQSPGYVYQYLEEDLNQMNNKNELYMKATYSCPQTDIHKVETAGILCISGINDPSHSGGSTGGSQSGSAS